MRKILGALALLVSFAANAAPTYVGSFNIYDGPYWEDNPVVYSAREAAVLIYGGVITDYSISIDPSLDYHTITHTGNYSGWGMDTVEIMGEDGKLDLGGSGYNSFTGNQYGSAFSAYVSDNVFAVNYVWRNDATVVPESASYGMLLAGLLLMAVVAKRNKA